MAGAELRLRDQEILWDVIEEARRDAPGEAVPPALLSGLQRLIPCDGGWWISFQHHMPHAHRTVLCQWLDADGHGVIRPPPDPADDPYWPLWWRGEGSWPLRTGNLRRVIHTGDFFTTERARRADPMRCEYPMLPAYLMILSLPARPGEVRRINFERGESHPFTERDRQVAALLRPHIWELLQEAEQRRRGVPRLTPREWEILELAGAGESYAEIAARLFLSVGTVRKHAEHVRERLGVHSVAAAAALALPRPNRLG
jgi:DNA-binding CsgD family transcriptional regulator